MYVCVDDDGSAVSSILLVACAMLYCIYTLYSDHGIILSITILNGCMSVPRALIIARCTVKFHLMPDIKSIGVGRVRYP